MSLLDPDDVTRSIRALWDERGRFDVTPCPYSTSELRDLEQAGREVGFLPEELATQRGRLLLAEMFPEMRSYALLPNNVVTNDEDPFGWFDYEAGIDAQRLDLDEGALLEQLGGEGLALLNLNQYIVASQDTKARTGHYLDERRSWTRVASRVDGHIVAARFDGAEMAEGLGNEESVDGSLLVAYDIGPEDRGPVLGGRSTALGPHRQVTTDHAAERERQVARYVELGFHKELGLDVDAYVASLPGVTARPEEYAGRFDVPLLVETRLSWKLQAQLAGINLSNHSLRTDYVPIDDRSRVPEAPYWAWFSGWGQRFPTAIAPADALAALAADEVGGSALELVAFHIAHPDVVDNGRWLEGVGFGMPDLEVHGLSNPVDASRVPCLYHWRGRAEVGANLHPVAYSLFRPLVRGATITTR